MRKTRSKNSALLLTRKRGSNRNLVDFHVEKQSQRERLSLVNVAIVMWEQRLRLMYDLHTQATMR